LSGGADERHQERLRAEQAERRRFAELVHDGPVQHLAALGQMLDALTHALDAGEGAAARAIAVRARAVAGDAAADLRDLAAALEPPALHDDGLAVAVRELADRVAVRRGIAVELELPVTDALGESARSGLYQIVREGLDQAVRRGPPTRVTVALTSTPGGGIELVLADDGARERRQAVLDGLAERAATLNGAFTYERVGTTTTITVRLPPSAAAL
jgi:signal transduction histidine kinase